MTTATATATTTPNTSSIFDRLQEHPCSSKFDQMSPRPKPGEYIQKFSVGRIKCVATLKVVLLKLAKAFPQDLKVIPHPSTVRACWVVETNTPQTGRKT